MATLLQDVLAYANLGENPDTGNTNISGFIDDLENRVRGIPRKKDENNDRMIIDRNIAKTAHSLTAVFPVIVSRSVPIEQAVMVSKAVERKAIGLLQMLFAANNISSAKNAFQYLKTFHHNISGKLDPSSMNVDDILDYTEFRNNEVGRTYWDMDKSSRSNNTSTQQTVSQDDPNTTEVQEDAMMIAEKNKIFENVKRNIHSILETEIANPSIGDLQIFHELNAGTQRSPIFMHGYTDKSDEVTRGFAKHGFDKSKSMGYVFTKDIKDNDGKVIHAKGSSAVYGWGNEPMNQADYANWVRGMGQGLSGQVLQTDVKKANEAQPSLMIVNFNTQHKETGRTVYNTCIIGVKALLHYVDPQDIVNRVLLKQEDSRGLFNLIKATTGEIAFFRDFLFSIKRAKVDAVAKAGKGSSDRIWKLLELRADHLNMARAARRGQADCSAIATLVISQAEVDHIKQYHRIDLNKAGALQSILRGYNMMCGVIVDMVEEKCDFLWDDGTKMFETLSFMSLEREDSGSLYKKVVNLAMKNR